MMVLSRIWYVVLSLLLGVALYLAYLAVGEYNRRNSVGTNEALASDSQVVGWALQIDARKRLDALLIGAVDKGLQDSLALADDKDKIPPRAKDDGKKALAAINDKIPADYKNDALFEVDHDGRVVAQVGFDQANPFDDFELGGYPAVFDALHGFLRDDTWLFGGKIYRVVARPVEFDVTQRPLGAIVGLRLVDHRFAQDISKRTRANVAFFAAGQRVASAAGAEGFDESLLEQITGDLGKLADDKSYADGRSDVHAVGENLGVIYARLPGDVWALDPGTGGGFAVMRPRVQIANPLGFLSSADDKDKQGVNWLVLAMVVALGIAGGMALSFLEQSLPMKEMQTQAGRLKRGELDYFQVPRFRGAYRGIAQDVNAGIERVVEKGGGAARKPADLESILGPVPQQPAMSAFSFPMADGNAPSPGPARPIPPLAGREPLATRPGVPPSRPGFPPAFGQPGPGPPPQAAAGGGQHAVTVATPFQSTIATSRENTAAPPASPFGGFQPQGGFPPPAGAAPAPSRAFSPPNTDHEADADGPTIAATQAPVAPAAAPTPAASASGPGPRRPPAPTMMGMGQYPQSGGQSGAPTPAAGSPALGAQMQGGATLNLNTTPAPFVPPGRPPAPSRPQFGGAATGSNPSFTSGGLGAKTSVDDPEEQDEATVIARAPSEILAAASGDNKAVGEAAEWLSVYDDFVRTKKQCGEPTEGLTFEKFQHTLKKNRDALIQRHGCKRVRFSVYIKDGRASLKATPVRD